jgi:acetyl-CoA decarbonylase/synthase complex subunit beta
MLADAIPEEMYNKIATEDDCVDPEELKAFLRRVDHPVVQLWKNGEVPEPMTIPPANTDWEPEAEEIARERGKKLVDP